MLILAQNIPIELVKNIPKDGAPESWFGYAVMCLVVVSTLMTWFLVSQITEAKKEAKEQSQRATQLQVEQNNAMKEFANTALSNYAPLAKNMEILTEKLGIVAEHTETHRKQNLEKFAEVLAALRK